MRYFAITLFSGFLGCASAHAEGTRAIAPNKIDFYKTISREKLTPFFQHAGVQFPPQQLALLIYKKNQRLDIWAKDAQHRHWVPIRSFEVLAASGDSGPKLLEGDGQVPEGIYHISHLNPYSHFDLSMELDYPNAFDRAQAKQDGRDHLGGDIFIHGGDRSIGCIAIGDEAIEQLFPLVAMVGVAHVQVIIAPNDFRWHTSNMAAVHPRWVEDLYQRIDRALNQFSSLQDHQNFGGAG